MGSLCSKTKTQFELIEMAEKKVKEDDFDSALDLFRQAIETQPTYYFSYLRRASLFRKMGRHQEALHDLDDCLRFRPNEWTAFEEKALVLEDMGDDDVAVMVRTKIPQDVRDRMRQREEAQKATESRYADRDQNAKDAIKHAYDRQRAVQGRRGLYLQSDRDRQRVLERQQFRQAVATLDSNRGGYTSVGPH
jgi:tetratricopeptide (TPR) repeat protein